MEEVEQESFKKAYFENLHLLGQAQREVSDLRASKAYRSEVEAKSNEIVDMKVQIWNLECEVRRLKKLVGETEKEEKEP